PCHLLPSGKPADLQNLPVIASDLLIGNAAMPFPVGTAAADFIVRLCHRDPGSGFQKGFYLPHVSRKSVAVSLSLKELKTESMMGTKGNHGAFPGVFSGLPHIFHAFVCLHQRFLRMGESRRVIRTARAIFTRSGTIKGITHQPSTV